MKLGFTSTLFIGIIIKYWIKMSLYNWVVLNYCLKNVIKISKYNSSVLIVF